MDGGKNPGPTAYEFLWLCVKHNTRDKVSLTSLRVRARLYIQERERKAEYDQNDESSELTNNRQWIGPISPKSAEPPPVPPVNATPA